MRARRADGRRLLVIVTLAEAGGAQTFVAELVRGLRDTYAIDVAAHGPEGALVDVCERLDVRFHHVANLVRDPDPRRDLAAVAEIRRLAARLAPDVVQVNSSKAGILARLGLAGHGAPVVFTAHGWAFSGRKGLDGRAYTIAERAVAPLTAAIVCVSRHDLGLALEHRVASPRRLHVIRNGVACAEAAPERGAWPASPLLACTARLAPPKDLLTLLDALATPELAHVRLRVLGEGPDRGRIEARRDELGLGVRVELCGGVDNVAEQLREADAFVLPTDWEGLPFSVLEAMAAGLPVVASAVGGVPELVLDGQTGYLVPRRDAPALAAAIAALDADGERARAMGRAGHERVRHGFSLTDMVGRYDALFGALLGERTTRSC